MYKINTALYDPNDSPCRYTIHVITAHVILAAIVTIIFDPAIHWLDVTYTHIMGQT